MKYRIVTHSGHCRLHISLAWLHVCAQGSSIAEYLDYSRQPVEKRQLRACVPVHFCEGIHAQVTSQLLNVVAELPEYPVCFTFVKVTGVLLRYTSHL